ncbi:MAG: RluA family pseudouridine synthase [Bacteroidetes bacterium QS_9_68_14]|nr:MAG: RluA family pseudouridine synthase [Bacteroidetes bacterium QS_9_68_14]
MSDSEPRRTGDLLTFEVPAEYAAAERLDKYLAARVETSRTKVQESIVAGAATVNGEEPKKARPVEGGDTIRLRLLRPPPVGAKPEDIPLDIAYEDEHLLVVHKPAGMVVHPGYGHRTGTLVNALLYHVGARPIEINAPSDELDAQAVGLSTVGAVPRQEGNPAVRPGIVHRLDKGTTGLLVVAKDNAAHRSLARQFRERTTRRRYEALLWGRPSPPEGTLEGAIGRDPRDRKKMAVVPAKRGKPARTHYRVAERAGHTARVAFRLETGRTHQIRVHAAEAGHPLLADKKYGGAQVCSGASGRKRRAFFERLFDRLGRPALHAASLGFRHPATGEEMDFTAETPDDLRGAWEELCRVEGT